MVVHRHYATVCSHVSKTRALVIECLTTFQSLGVCKSFAIPENYLDMTHEKLFSGQLPSRVVVGLVSNQAFNGHATSNSFNFRHFNLSEIALYLDGQQQHAIRPIQPNYENGMYIRAYDSLFAGTGKLCKDEGL